MKIFYFIFLGCCLLGAGCGIREREEALEQRENEINQKEQNLLLLQKQLQLKEQELLQLQKSIDSTRFLTSAADSAVVNPLLAGSWAVTMRCTETTCEGSAVGDIKNERWEISYQDKNVIVKAFADNQLVRTYTGFFTENNLDLTARQDESTPQAKMTARLAFKTNTELEGEREITRANKCHIIYSLHLRKQQ